MPCMRRINQVRNSQDIQVFHFFFIPVFRWNTRYLRENLVLRSLYELDPAVGKEFERSDIEIRNENLRRVENYPHFNVIIQIAGPIFRIIQLLPLLRTNAVTFRGSWSELHVFIVFFIVFIIQVLQVFRCKHLCPREANGPFNVHHIM